MFDKEQYKRFIWLVSLWSREVGCCRNRRYK